MSDLPIIARLREGHSDLCGTLCPTDHHPCDPQQHHPVCNALPALLDAVEAALAYRRAADDGKSLFGPEGDNLDAALAALAKVQP